MEKNSCPINTIACGNEDGLFLLCSLVVAQERPVELEIQQLLTREVSLTKHLEIVRQTLRHPTHHRLRHARAAQNVRERRLDVTRRHPVHVHSSDQLIQFFRPTHIRIENLRTKTCRCLSNLRHLDRHRSFAGENSMRFIPVTTAFLLRRLRSVLVVASTQRFRHLTLQCVLKHHLRSRPNDLRQIHIPEYQSFLKLLEQSLTW